MICHWEFTIRYSETFHGNVPALMQCQLGKSQRERENNIANNQVLKGLTYVFYT